MNLGFCSFSSGSSGNCYLIKSESSAILVDCGISAKKIINGLGAANVPPEMLRGILITHEHVDHVRSLKTVVKKIPYVNVYASRGTWEGIFSAVPVESHRTVNAGREFEAGDIKVRCFALSHDGSEPIGYSFFSGGCQISIVTDTGEITDEIHGEIKGADILVLEANHDEETLKFCKYPYSVKRRILGVQGHLSNAAAAEEICRIIREDGKYREIILAHLSRENNFPEMAYQTVKNMLDENRFYIGGHLGLHILMRDEISPIFTL